MFFRYYLNRKVPPDMFRILSIISLCLLLAIGLGILVFSGNADILDLHAKLLQSYARHNPEAIDAEWNQSKEAAIQRMLTYRNFIMRDFLLDDMVINRENGDAVSDLCDSLLFSSLLYVAWNKIGLDHEARVIFNGIKGAENNGKWWRHPRCNHRLSRDMVVGVLAAMSQRPPEAKAMLSRFLHFVAMNQGYVGDGPFYVSFLSPGLVELSRHVAVLNGVRPKDIPKFFFQGYSTLELDTLWPQRGYHSHLSALVIWLEMDLAGTVEKHGFTHQPALFTRNLPNEIKPFFAAITNKDLHSSRHQWLTYRLLKNDKKNLFFRYLHLRASHALTLATRLLLLRELLAMKQFPKDRPPDSCDRKADYLWQRDSLEKVPQQKGSCQHRFNGVDFIWLASLLLEDTNVQAAELVEKNTEDPD